MVRAPGDADEMVALLRRTSGLDEGGSANEQVTALGHSLQCAAILAAGSPDDLGLQIAGLVHDVGHLATPRDPDAHGRAGAVLVADLLGARVASLVELHVPAKRYLITTDPSYRSTLSENSAWTLEMQGGEMTPDEQATFEAEPLSSDAITLRRADEQAKVPGRRVPGLEHWRPIIVEFLG